MGNTVLASNTGGKIVFEHQNLDTGVVSDMNLTPVKLIISSFASLLKGFTEVLKDKKKMVSIIVLSVVWLALMVLHNLGFKNNLLSILNFITFAQAGTIGGLLGIVGGIAGKALYAYFFAQFVLPLFNGKNTFNNLSSGMKNAFALFKINNKKSLSLVMCALGAALITYNFFAGSAAIKNSMIGIIAFIMILSSFAHKTGFLRSLVISMINKYVKIKPDISIVNQVISAWAMGFALGVILSGIGVRLICYYAGIVLILPGIILFSFTLREKEAK